LGRLGWRRLGWLRLLPSLLASLRLLRLGLWRPLVAGPALGLGRRLGWRLGRWRLGLVAFG
jgi:hypothetical protein